MQEETAQGYRAQAARGREAETLLNLLSPRLECLRAQTVERFTQAPDAWALQSEQALLRAYKAIEDNIRADVTAGRMAEHQLAEEES